MPNIGRWISISVLMMEWSYIIVISFYSFDKIFNSFQFRQVLLYEQFHLYVNTLQATILAVFTQNFFLFCIMTDCFWMTHIWSKHILCIRIITFFTIINCALSCSPNSLVVYYCSHIMVWVSPFKFYIQHVFKLLRIMLWTFFNLHVCVILGHFCNSNITSNDPKLSIPKQHKNVTFTFTFM